MYASVDPYLEVTEIVDRTVKSGGPALLFHRVGDSLHPMPSTSSGLRRMCTALGIDSLDTDPARLSEPMEMRQPFSFSESMRGMAKFRRLTATEPVSIDTSASSKEGLLEPNLDQLPIQHCWPGDPAPLITFCV
jgi:4-hydroxy-3-polyprenylbenzoate decarboxylase